MYIHSPVRPNGVVLNWLSTGTTLPFCLLILLSEEYKHTARAPGCSSKLRALILLAAARRHIRNSLFVFCSSVTRNHKSETVRICEVKWSKLLTIKYFGLILMSLNDNMFLLLTYLRSWALLEKPPIVQPLKNFPAFYGTRRFSTVFTRALHWSLSWISFSFLLFIVLDFRSNVITAIKTTCCQR
jgi:hypothetical protein